MSAILFRNANLVVEGLTKLQPGFDVLVKDNYIDSVSSTPIGAADATVMSRD